MSVPTVSSTTTVLPSDAGTEVCVVFGAAYRGVLNRLRVIQDSDSSADGYQYAVFESTRAFNTDGTLSTVSELYRVSPNVTVAGSSRVGADNVSFNLNYAFRNRDADIVDPATDFGNTATKHKLYLWLKSTSLASKTFTVNVACLHTSPTT